MNWLYVGGAFWSLVEISFWAKKASTTTMRMGKAALLKNLLMRGTRTAFASLGKGLRVPGALSAPRKVLRGWSADRWPGWSRPVGLWLRQRGDVRQVSVALGHVEAVADRELVRDLEAHVARRQLDLAALGLGQQRADLQRGRLARAEVAQQVLQGQPRVDDVLDDQHVASRDRAVEVLEDPHHARGIGLRAVGGDRHEVDLAWDVDVAHEVGQEEDRALEDAHQQQVALGVVGRDLPVDLADLRLEVVGLDEDLADLGVPHRLGTLTLRRAGGRAPHAHGPGGHAGARAVAEVQRAVVAEGQHVVQARGGAGAQGAGRVLGEPAQ